MSIRLEMLQVARLAPKVLGESAGLVQSFLTAQQNRDGGFKDRTGKSDLYYTVFGMEGLLALQAPLDVPALERFLDEFGTGEGLDFVHLCCLARCRANLSGANPSSTPKWGAALTTRLEQFRTTDGGYHPIPGAQASAVYGCFLAAGVYQDLRIPIPDAGRLAEVLMDSRTEDGVWANERSVRLGATNSTAAAVTLLRNLGVKLQPSVGDWLLSRRHALGGFVALPGAPIPDLLSTATALHALSGLQREIDEIREGCLDFIDSLWTNAGAFHGHWDDSHLDCEYTYYGLLALGHLSL